MYEASLIAKCDDVGEDGDVGGYDDIEDGKDGDVGGEVGEVDQVGGSDKVRQLL